MEHSARRTVVAQDPRLSDSHPLNTSRPFAQVRSPRRCPRVSVARRLEEAIKHGYVERVGNADKVNIPDLQKKLQKTWGS